jgi:gamma-glutamyltranspeptidase / glutathione hydrolase
MRASTVRAHVALALMTISAVPVLAQVPVDPLLRETGAGDRYFGPPFAARSPTIARNGMAATSHPLATQVALEVLRAGGNAIDAAIAANAAIGVLEPTGNGIGGDLFAILWSARDGRLYGLNGSGRSPGSLSLEELRRQLGTADEIPLLGPLPVTVPGAVDGWWALHQRFGSAEWRTLLEPAAQYAEEGAPVPPYIAGLWARATRLADQPGFARTFLPDGRPPGLGEVFRNPDLARTLRRIGEGGRDVFYEGEIATEIERFCARVGCHLTAADLAAHRAEWVEPISVDFHGFTVHQIPPNGQGLALLQMLRILEPYDLRSMGQNSAAYLHHLIEAKKIAYEDRARFYADPAAAEVPVERLLSSEYAAERRRLLDPTRARMDVEPGDPRAGRGGTIYLAVGDTEGNLVSLIQSNYAGFGSGLVPDGLGFGLQDRGAGFTLDPGHPNVYAPGKRPFHTIIPGFVTREGAPYLAFGVMGGDVQPQGQLQVFLNHVLFGMDVQTAGDAARWRHEGSTEPSWPAGRRMTDGGCVSLERGIREPVRERLRDMGHRMCDADWTHFGGYQAVQWDAANRVYWGATESRVDGQAAGW